MNFAEQMKKIAEDVVYKKVIDEIQPIFKEIDRVIREAAEEGLFCLKVRFFSGTTTDGGFVGTYTKYKSYKKTYEISGFSNFRILPVVANECKVHYEKEGFEVITSSDSVDIIW